MAVHRLPSIHMSSAFQGARKDKDTTGDSPRRLDEGRKLEPSSRLQGHSQYSWTRSPSLTLKRPAYAFPLQEDFPHPQHQQDGRVPFEAFDAMLSPSQRKRRRGDSDMSVSHATGVTPTFGNVRITSTYIHAMVSESANDRQHRSVAAFDDAELVGRDSWAGASSRSSGRDSDLCDGMPLSPPAKKDGQQEGADENSGGDRSSVTNASRNISFEMLQSHFSKPLKDAASHFGVCTTLLKKVCRKNGILSWPYRQIIGLEKSIASMEQQVHYFDGEQRRQYAAQLHKLQIKLDAYIRTGQAPAEEEIASAMTAGSSPIPLSNAPQPADTTLPKESHHRHQSQESYYYAPQESVMASAVTLDAEEPPQRYEPQPQHHILASPTFDQRYAATTNYTSQTGYYAQRPLPSLASILNQPSQQHQKSQPDKAANYEHHWKH